MNRKSAICQLPNGEDLKVSTLELLQPPLDIPPRHSLSKVFAEYLEYISELILNPGEVQKFWHAWCMMKGPWWVDHFNNIDYPFDRGDKDKLLSALALRNGHTCEAHNEIITTFLKLAAHGNDTGHDEYIRKIEILQKGRIP